MRAIFLTGKRVYLRGMLEDDKSSAIAWYDTLFPVNSAFAEDRLTTQHATMWDAARRQLAIVRVEDDTVVGGAVIGFASDRRAEIRLHMAPTLEDGDELQAEALHLLVPWLLNDHNMRRVHIGLAVDDTATVAAARELDMVDSVRLREFFYKQGKRVDMVIFQVLNPNEEHQHA